LNNLDFGKLLKKKTLAALLADFETLVGQTTTFDLYDTEGEPLFVSTALPAEEFEAALHADLPTNTTRTLVVEGELVGILVATAPCSSSQLDAAADLLIYLITGALENRALAHETLERYREINLLYRIQEAIGAQLDLDQSASLVLSESIRVIKATTGALLLLTADQLAFNVKVRHGEAPIKDGCSHTDTIAGWVVRNQRATIVNDVSADPRCGPADARARSLLCVPLTIGDKSIGALMLYDKADDDIFTASDQKLLAALASQAAIAIETARAVETRESRLQAQIHELRIEIDEIRKRSQVSSVTATDYFARLQQSAQEMRREFEEGL
jgi:hypothetical protein